MDKLVLFKKIMELKYWIFPKKCTFILADNKNDRVLILKKDSIYYTGYKSLFTFNGNTSHFNLKRERGKILSAFCGIEMIISELFVIKLGGFNNFSKQNLIRETIDKLTTAQKIDTLYTEKIIPKNLKSKLWQLIQFRNQIAHEYVLRELKYGNKNVIDDKQGHKTELTKDNSISFQKIESDFFAAWHHLISVYSEHQEPAVEWVEARIIKSIARANN